MASDSDLPFDCPLCGAAFAVPREMLGQPAQCPHCNGAVQLPSAEELAALPAATQEESAAAIVEESIAAVDPAAPREAEQRGLPEPATDAKQATAGVNPAAGPRTRQERAAARQRLNRTLAVIGGVILAITFVLLASLG